MRVCRSWIPFSTNNSSESLHPPAQVQRIAALGNDPRMLKVLRMGNEVEGRRDIEVEGGIEAGEKSL